MTQAQESSRQGRGLVVAVIVSALVAALTVYAVIAAQGPTSSTNIRYALVRFVGAGVLGLAWPWWRLRANVGRPGWGVVVAAVLPAALLVGAAIFGVLMSQTHFLGVRVLLVFGLSMLSVGILEEVLARGFVFGILARATAPSGVSWAAVVWSSVIFGLAHLSNLSRGGAVLVPVLFQVVWASLIGVYFAALRARTSRLWPCVLVHAALDFGFYLAADCFAARAPFPSVLVPLVLAIGLAIWGVVLLRSLAPAEKGQLT